MKFAAEDLARAKEQEVQSSKQAPEVVVDSASQEAVPAKKVVKKRTSKKSASASK